MRLALVGLGHGRGIPERRGQRAAQSFGQAPMVVGQSGIDYGRFSGGGVQLGFGEGARVA